MTKPQIVAHVDMDAFFASVEQRDDPTLRGWPVLVGGSPTGRGVVSAASYEARQYGCHSAMPMAQAVRLCPHARICRGRYDVYQQVSQQVRDIFDRHSLVVEPLGLDEAFLDLTHVALGPHETWNGTEPWVARAQNTAFSIKQQIRKECNLPATVGLASVKFIAKLACGLGKPDGLKIVEPSEILDLLEPLPIDRLWGVGKVTAEKLRRLGFQRIGQLRQVDHAWMVQHFGIHGQRLLDLAWGRDARTVSTHRDRKSISHESTFSSDRVDAEGLEAELHRLTDQVADRLRQKKLRARGLTLKIRFADFRTLSRSTHWKDPIDDRQTLWHHAQQLWRQETFLRQGSIRLLGVAVRRLVDSPWVQGDLFAPSTPRPAPTRASSDDETPPHRTTPTKPVGWKDSLTTDDQVESPSPEVPDELSPTAMNHPTTGNRPSVDAAVDRIRQQFGSRAVQSADQLQLSPRRGQGSPSDHQKKNSQNFDEP